ncbi:putative Na+/H+ antiporter (fragment) [Flavobacterium psychrophilum]
MGLGKSIFEGTLLGKVLGFTTRIINPDRLLDKITGKERLFTNSIFDDRTRQIIAKNKTPLGILVDNELNYTDKIFVPFFGTEDAFLVDYIQKFVYNNNSKIKIIDINNQIENNFLIKNAIQTLEKTYPDNIALVNENQILKSFLIKQDLMVISLDSWKKLVDSQSVWLSNLPSVLIIKP